MRQSVHDYLSCWVSSKLKQAPGDGVGSGVMTRPEELASVGSKLLWVHRRAVLVVDQPGEASHRVVLLSGCRPLALILAAMASSACTDRHLLASPASTDRHLTVPNGVSTKSVPKTEV